MTRAPRWATPAVVAGTLLAGWALVVSFTGGFRADLGGIRISSTFVQRPLVAGVVLILVGLLYRDSGALLRRLARPRVLRAFVVALALVTLGVGMAYSTYVAGGPDPHGYVSQAALWRQGTLISTAPYVVTAPWATPAFAPIGYVPGYRAGEIVPQYPPGLPMIMAAFQLIGGERAAYYVVPLMGAAAVWLTYALGTVIGGPLAGAIAAVTFAASPTFLFQLMFPMSDVPATALWLAAAVLAIRDRTSATVLSGLATTLAILVRPNLVLLAPAVFVLVMHAAGNANSRVRRAAMWLMPALVGPVVLALLQYRFYGSPMKSGYGDMSGLFAAAYLWTNVTHYSAWLMDRQTPYILLGIAALPLLRRGGSAQQVWLAAWALVFTALVVLSYAFYLPFPDWYFLRFLMPAFPMLLATAATVVVQLGARSMRTQAVALAVVVIAVGAEFSGADSAFTMRQDQSRYRAAAVEARSLPRDAIVIGNLHSGSVHYYANLQTVRFEWIQASEYQRMMTFLDSLHRPLFVMLDNLEIEDFRTRFQGVADLSWLDEQPLKIINERVRLYRLPSTRW